MKIAILGTGNIGGTLGRKWAHAGHSVVYGTRDPGSSKALDLLSSSPGAKAETVPNAMAVGEVVLFALPWAALPQAAESNKKALAGKILIDATNNFFGEGVINNKAALVASAPDAFYFRAFNSLGWEVFAKPQYGSHQADHFFCGPDGPARDTVATLITEIGLRPIWVGENDQIELVDYLGKLWVTLVFRRGFSRSAMFKFMER